MPPIASLSTSPGGHVRRGLPLPLLCVSGLVALILALVVLRREYGPRASEPSSGYADAPGLLTTLAAARPEPKWPEAEELGGLLDALWRGREPERVPEALPRPAQPVYVGLREDGALVAQHWGTQGPAKLDALREALDAVRSSAAATK